MSYVNFWTISLEKQTWFDPLGVIEQEMALVQLLGLGSVCNKPCDDAKIIHIPSCIISQVVEISENT